MPPQGKEVSHCFALNGDIFKPECVCIEGVIETYMNAIHKVHFSGPTNFTPLLKFVNDMTESMGVSQLRQKYNILLIITDGLIIDLGKTIDEIVRGSDLPLSIIIVGVGNEDFSAMNQLDADRIPLFSQKYYRKASRDIVQFVPFSEYQDNPTELARKVLEELPT